MLQGGGRRRLLQSALSVHAAARLGCLPDCQPWLPTCTAACRYVRLRQLAPWAFAGAPGHPALRELCTRIAASASKRRAYTPNPGTQRHELSGAGLFTDVLLRHAAAHPPSAHDDPWGVRLLPRVRFGAPLKPAYGLTPGDLGVAVLHHGRPGSQGDEDEEGSR